MMHLRLFMPVFVLVVIFGFTNLSFATFQSNDILLFEGEKFLTPVYPLEDNKPVAEKLRTFIFESTGNLKGYTATWLIENNKLYLTGISGWIYESSNSKVKATLEQLFPGKVKDGRVHADWYSGAIYSPGLRWGAELSEKERKMQEEDARFIVVVTKGQVEKIINKIANDGHIQYNVPE